MRFYFNSELGMCGSETYVADYLYMSGSFDSREEATKALNDEREVYGWCSCEVSKDIKTAMEYFTEETKEWEERHNVTYFD